MLQRVGTEYKEIERGAIHKSSLALYDRDGTSSTQPLFANR